MSLADEEDVLAALRSEAAKMAGDMFGLQEAQASELAAAITAWLQQKCGGRELYVRARSRKERDRAVVADFDGRNHAEVCRAHGISLATLYRILERAR